MSALWVVLLLAAFQGCIAFLLSRYVSLNDVESLAVPACVELALMALLTFFFSGLWRADVRDQCARQSREASYDGSLESDAGRGWDAACVVVVRKENASAEHDAKGPTVAYVSGGAWHRGTPDHWFYAGNVLGRLSSQYKDVVGASIGYRRCKTPPLTLYIGYPLYVIGCCLLPGLAAAAVVIPTKLANWPAVVAASLLLALLYLWVFCFHPADSGNWRPCMPTATADDMLRDIARGLRHLKDRAAGHGQDASLSVLCHSAGAHLVAFLLLDGRHLKEMGLSPDDIAAVALISGPLDIVHMMREHLSRVASCFMRHMAMLPTFGGETEWALWNVDAALVTRSQLSNKIGPRWLILTGREDEVVSPLGSDNLAVALRELDCDVTRSTFEGGHSPANFGREGDKVIPAVAGFFFGDGGNGGHGALGLVSLEVAKASADAAAGARSLI